MAQLPTSPWIHIGECPICTDGLCRVRCTDLAGSKHLYALCDECEAIWLQPSTAAPHHFPDAEDPVCPLTGVPLYGADSRWATTEDIRGTEWENEVVIDLPCNVDLGEGDSPLVTREDIAGALDVPPIAETRSDRYQPTAQEARTEDLAYGQDEPRPGC